MASYRSTPVPFPPAINIDMRGIKGIGVTNNRADVKISLYIATENAKWVGGFLQLISY